MNSVVLIGRLTRDPEMRSIAETQTSIATFSIAINRPVRNGAEKKTDFPRIIVFGKQAENCERYLSKGRLIGIQGRIQTGSYKTQSGETRYTTDVFAERVEFLEWGEKGESTSGHTGDASSDHFGIPEGFEELDKDDDIPF